MPSTLERDSARARLTGVREIERPSSWKALPSPAAQARTRPEQKVAVKVGLEADRLKDRVVMLMCHEVLNYHDMAKLKDMGCKDADIHFAVTVVAVDAVVPVDVVVEAVAVAVADEMTTIKGVSPILSESM